MDIWGKDIPGRRKRKFKGLEFRNRPRVTQKTQPRATGGMGGGRSLRLRGVGGSRARWWGSGGLRKNFGLREMKSHSDVLMAGEAF